ncbi:MAG: hypothetical protein ACRD0W_22305 [Acidimicrobiales bacterium]
MKIAKADVFVGFKGDSVRIAGGAEYPDNHPLVAAHPDFFINAPRKAGRPLGSKNRPKTDET